jgi:hypothetical protein
MVKAFRFTVFLKDSGWVQREFQDVIRGEEADMIPYHQKVKFKINNY